MGGGEQRAFTTKAVLFLSVSFCPTSILLSDQPRYPINRVRVGVVVVVVVVVVKIELFDCCCGYLRCYRRCCYAISQYQYR